MLGELAFVRFCLTVGMKSKCLRFIHLSWYVAMHTPTADTHINIYCHAMHTEYKVVLEGWYLQLVQH